MAEKELGLFPVDGMIIKLQESGQIDDRTDLL
jgi:hypothetical protein